MFEGWDSFYLLVGGAAGALIGLLFIVVTLIRGGDAGDRLRGASVFMTPTVAHLAMVMALSAVAAAPKLPMPAVGVLVLLCALVYAGFTGRALIMLLNGSIKATHWSDVWGYGAVPFATSVMLGAAAAAIWYAPDWAARGIASVVLIMLLIAIRNAWDLVTWISARGDELGRRRD